MGRPCQGRRNFGLTAVYFEGSPPNGGSERFRFDGVNPRRLVLYLRPEAKGWGETFGGLPVKVWEE